MNMKVEEIKTHTSFEGIFTINEELLGRIEQDMSEGRYDFSQPIILATWEGQKEPVCIDGHTRLQAAKDAGIKEVPVFTHEFETEEEATEKAIKLQRNRRNMTDAEITACIQTLDKKKPRGGDRRSEEAKSKASGDAIEKSGSKSAAQTADILGISTSKVEKTRSVLNNGDPETIEAMKNGDMSINKACQKTRKERSKQKKKTNAKPLTNNSKEDATEVGQVPVGETAENEEKPLLENEGDADETDERNYVIPDGYYNSLKERGGSVTEHLNRAIYVYLSMLEEDVIEILRDNGYDEDLFPYEDDEEYFDPDAYEPD